MRILAIGECMAELSPLSEDGQYSLGFAGDTFNTCWYLARLWPHLAVSYLTAIGSDQISRDLLRFIVASGIDDTHVQTVPDRTLGLYLIRLTQGEREFSYWRSQSAARCLAQDTLAIRRAIMDADLVYFSGITLAILDPRSRETLFKSLKEARMQGKIIAFDPNLRPRLWNNAKLMTEVTMRGASLCDIALPSLEDEMHWFGDSDSSGTVERYARSGASLVVVKNGAGAVRFLDVETRGEVQVPRVVHPVDTTAAGDSFNSAILAGYCDKLPLRESVIAAINLSSKVVRSKGALVEVGVSALTCP